jgi:hypothetical protein
MPTQLNHTRDISVWRGTDLLMLPGWWRTGEGNALVIGGSVLGRSQFAADQDVTLAISIYDSSIL